jgi:uncharacterized repeat protein (TIGR03843 family)
VNDQSSPFDIEAIDDAAKALRSWTIEQCQLVPWGSNYTFAVVLRDPVGACDDQIGIYKPRAGEAPLWDFPPGSLYQREHAAFLLSRALGWRFIPETVIRDGPHGIGTVQRYVEPEPDVHYFNIREQLREHRDELQRVALFDLLTNNADRKAGHCFRGKHDGRIWGIDHGLTFNVQPKLRTVIWEFCGEPIADELLERVLAVATDDQLVAPLRRYLEPLEIQALRGRAERIVDAGIFPQLNSRRNIPYGW